MIANYRLPDSFDKTDLTLGNKETNLNASKFHDDLKLTLLVI